MGSKKTIYLLHIEHRDHFGENNPTVTDHGYTADLSVADKFVKNNTKSNPDTGPTRGFYNLCELFKG